ncbi:hypothetical protein HERIO_2364, partial [Hepatospora eriocheir]
MFKNVETAVEFYLQHFKKLSMKFSILHELEKEMLFYKNLNNFKYDFPKKEFNFKTPKLNIIDVKSFKNNHKKSTMITNCSGKAEFNLRVDYFNKMRSMFPKNDVVRMKSIIDSGIKDILFLNTKELSVGTHSNILIQEGIKSMSENELYEIIKSLGIDIVPIAATKYGAYTIQTLLMNVKGKESLDLLCDNFSPLGQYLITDEIGNYTIQRLLRHREDIVYNLFVQDLESIINNPLGFKVLSRCLEFFVNNKENFLNKIKNIKNNSNKEKCE